MTEVDVAAGFMVFVRTNPEVDSKTKEFFAEHADNFADFGESDEHKHEYQEIYLKYVALVEGFMAEYLAQVAESGRQADTLKAVS